MTNNIDGQISIVLNQIINSLSDSYADSAFPNSSYKLIGLAIWDIFSNNNVVINDNNVELDLGSWNDAAQTIADCINELTMDTYDSSDFSEGREAASGVRSVDQLDLYTDIFILFHEFGWDWKCGSQIEFNVCVMDSYPLQAYKMVYKK